MDIDDEEPPLLVADHDAPPSDPLEAEMADLNLVKVPITIVTGTAYSFITLNVFI